MLGLVLALGYPDFRPDITANPNTPFLLLPQFSDAILIVAPIPAGIVFVLKGGVSEFEEDLRFLARFGKSGWGYFGSESQFGIGTIVRIPTGGFYRNGIAILQIVTRIGIAVSKSGFNTS